MATRRPSPEERDLFRTAVREARPLRRPSAPASPKPASPIATPQKPSPARKAAVAPAPASPPKLPPAAGLDRRLGERLRRGQLPIEAVLDLHGMTQDEAHQALDRFVADAHEEGRRVLLVVTGKGLGRAEGGVLRAAVPRWLEEGPCRPKVLAHAPARPKHGGAGALYLLLRRRRER
jgi:DNA-nicking Smr family endonuclease